MKFPHCWIMIWMLSSGIMVSFCLKISVSILIQSIIIDLNWTEKMKGYFLSSFYWGYALGKLPAARLCQCYGSKWIFGLCILIPCLLCLISPLTIRYSFSITIFLRVLMGLLQSACYPACFFFYEKWIPLQKKTIMIVTLMSSSQLGEILGLLLTNYLITTDVHYHVIQVAGWELVYYAFGIIGIVWFPLWAIIATERPEDNSMVMDDELLAIRQGKISPPTTYRRPSSSQGTQSTQSTPPKTTPVNHPPFGRALGSNYLSNYIDHDHSDDSSPYLLYYSEDEDENSTENYTPVDIAANVPWIALLTHPAAVTIYLVSISSGWMNIMLLTETPTYFSSCLHFSLKSSGYLSALVIVPRLLSGLGFGKLFEYLEIEHKWHPRAVRQVSVGIAFLGSTLFLVACSFMKSTDWALVSLLTALLCYGAVESGIPPSFSDVSRNYSGLLNTIGNTIGTLGGSISPVFVSYCLVAWPEVVGWRVVFITTGLLLCLTLAVWRLFQTSDLVPSLNRPREAVLRKEAEESVPNIKKNKVNKLPSLKTEYSIG